MNQNLGEYGDLLMMPAALIVLAFIFLVMLAVIGYSMKWSVNLVDAGPIGFFYGLLTAIIMSVAGVLTNIGMVLITKTQNPWILMCYSMTAGILVIAVMAQCNPFKAFLAYLCNMVFSTLAMVGVTIGMVIILFTLSQANLVKLPSNSPAMIGNVQSGWGRSTPPSVNTKFITEAGGTLKANPFGK